MSNHKSDCAAHNEPAYPNGECDCGAEPTCLFCGAKMINETQEPMSWFHCETVGCLYETPICDAAGIPAAHNALAGVIAVARDVANGEDCIWSLMKAIETLDKFKAVSDALLLQGDYRKKTAEAISM